MKGYGEVVLGVESALPGDFDPFGRFVPANRGGGRAGPGKEGREHGYGAALPLRQLALAGRAGSNRERGP